MTLRILITGSRDWTNTDQVYDAIWMAAGPWVAANVTVVHGGARGADTIAGEVAKRLGFNVEVHSSDWERYGKRAGLVRNSEMVAAGADICLAFPLGESRGTRHCMREAEKASIPVIVHEWVTA
jgi:YspA, cpYpsA-related SLOG family